jgi:hypothetical protein
MLGRRPRRHCCTRFVVRCARHARGEHSPRSRMVVAIKPVSAILSLERATRLLCASDRRPWARSDSDAKQFRNITAADHAPHICRLQSGSYLRVDIIPAGLWLRLDGRARPSPMAFARIKAFDPLRAWVRGGPLRLRGVRPEHCECGPGAANMSPRSSLANATTRAGLWLRTGRPQDARSRSVGAAEARI